MVPHLLHEHHGLPQRIPLHHRRRAFRARFGDPVALRAVPVRERLLAARGVARLVEEARRIQVGEQIGGVRRAQLGPLDAGPFHGRPHDRRVVPHGARQQRGRKATVHPRTQIHAHLATLAIHAVTRDAALVFKELGASLGVAWDHRRHSGPRAPNHQNANAKLSHHRFSPHYTSFFRNRSIRRSQARTVSAMNVSVGFWHAEDG